MLRDLTKNYGEIPSLLWRLLATQGCMNATHFMAFPLFAVYMANDLGFQPGQLGTVLTVHLVTRQVLPSLTGPIADRFGLRIFLIAGLFLRGAGLIGFAFWTDWLSLSAMAFLIGLGTASVRIGHQRRLRPSAGGAGGASLHRQQSVPQYRRDGVGR